MAVVALAGWLAGQASFALAAHLHIDRSYYRISGQNRQEIKASVRMAGPKGGSAYGLSAIDFLPQWKTRSDGPVCRIVRADVGLRIAMRLPRWQARFGSSGKPPTAARHFVAAVERHEMGHVSIARRYAADMARRLSKLSSKEGCRALHRAAGEMIAAMKQRHRAAHRAYDNRTRRGIKRLLN